PLSNRTNIILTKRHQNELGSGVFCYSNINDILWEYRNYGDEQVNMFICGGERVFSDFLPYADYIHLTIVDNVFEHSDRYFPEFSLDEFEVVSNVKNAADEKYPYDYYFITYKRKDS